MESPQNYDTRLREKIAELAKETSEPDAFENLKEYEQVQLLSVVDAIRKWIKTPPEEREYDSIVGTITEGICVSSKK